MRAKKCWNFDEFQVVCDHSKNASRILYVGLFALLTHHLREKNTLLKIWRTHKSSSFTVNAFETIIDQAAAALPFFGSWRLQTFTIKNLMGTFEREFQDFLMKGLDKLNLSRLSSFSVSSRMIPRKLEKHVSYIYICNHSCVKNSKYLLISAKLSLEDRTGASVQIGTNP